MALQIVTPKASFVRWAQTDVLEHCIFDNIRQCLPVFEEDDVAFQFLLEGSPAEIQALCGPYGTAIQVGIVNNCADPAFLIEFPQAPDVFRLSDTQLLVNWTRGLPGFATEISIYECFKIRVKIGLETFCSNCFERINEECFTSVVEYSSDENSFGFNYCGSGAIQTSGGAATDCEPTLVLFTNQTILAIPYTTQLQDKYGPAPTVQVWIYDLTGELINATVQIAFDTYPPNFINVDLGGVASGVLIIK